MKKQDQEKKVDFDDSAATFGHDGARSLQKIAAPDSTSSPVQDFLEISDVAASVPAHGVFDLVRLFDSPDRAGDLVLDAATHQAVKEIDQAARNQNTLTSYRHAARYWQLWHQHRFAMPIKIPVPVATIIRFITDHAWRGTDRDSGLPIYDLPQNGVEQSLLDAGIKSAPGPMSLATLRHRLAAISRAHTISGHPSPTTHPRVREIIRNTSKLYGRNRPVESKPPITLEPLGRILATCDNSLIGKRDAAMILFAWSSGGRRRSEVCAATMDFLHEVDDGYFYDLRVSKTNQDGAASPDNKKPLQGRAAHALREWLSASGIKVGALFPSIHRGGVISKKPISTTTFNKIVKTRAALAGVPAGKYGVSAHSLRSGFVTDAVNAGFGAQGQAMTGHKDPRVYAKYIRQRELLNSPVSRMADLNLHPTQPSANEPPYSSK
jgi:integrase